MKAYVIVNRLGQAVFASLSADLVGRKVAEIALESLNDGSPGLPGYGCTVQQCDFAETPETFTVVAKTHGTVECA